MPDGQFFVQGPCGLAASGTGRGEIRVTISPAPPGTYSYTTTFPGNSTITAWDENGGLINTFCCVAGSVTLEYQNAIRIIEQYDTVHYPHMNEVSVDIYTDPCGEGRTIYLPTDTVRLSLVQGGEYGSLYVRNGWNWDSVGTIINDACCGSYAFRPSCSYVPGSATITLQASVDDKAADTSFIEITDDRRLQFMDTWGEYETNLYEMHHGEEMDVWVTGKRGDGTQASIGPSECVTYTYEIIQDSDLGTLHDYFDTVPEQDGCKVTDVYQDGSYGRSMSDVYFRAFGRDPFAPETVLVRVSATDPLIRADTLAIVVGPGNLVVTACPVALEFGDTSHIEVRKRQPDGSLVPLAPDCNLGLSIAGEYDVGGGYLQSEDGTHSGRFFAQHTWAEEEPLMHVWIRAELYDEGASGPPSTPYPSMGVAEVTVSAGTAQQLMAEARKSRARVVNTASLLNF